MFSGDDSRKNFQAILSAERADGLAGTTFDTQGNFAARIPNDPSNLFISFESLHFATFGHFSGLYDGSLLLVIVLVCHCNFVRSEEVSIAKHLCVTKESPIIDQIVIYLQGGGGCVDGYRIHICIDELLWTTVSKCIKRRTTRLWMFLILH